MASYTITAQAASNWASSTGTTFTAARNGGTKAIGTVASDTNLYVGAYRQAASNHIHYESFISFDTSVIPAGEVVVAAYVRLVDKRDIAGPTTVVLKPYDWGTAVETTDWRTGAQFAALSPRSYSSRPGVTEFVFSSEMGNSSIVKGGVTRYVLGSQNFEYSNYVETEPRVAFWSPRAALAANRPTLYVETVPANALLNVGGAATQLNDGSHISVRNGSVNDQLIVERIAPVAGTTATPTTLATLSGTFDTSSASAEGMQTVAVVADSSDNIYVIGKAIGRTDVIALALKKTGTTTWVAQSPLSAPLPSYGTIPATAIAAQWFAPGQIYVSLNSNLDTPSGFLGSHRYVVLATGALLAGTSRLVQANGSGASPYGELGNGAGSNADVAKLSATEFAMVLGSFQSPEGPANSSLAVYPRRIDALAGRIYRDNLRTYAPANGVLVSGDSKMRLVTISSSLMALVRLGGVTFLDNNMNVVGRQTFVDAMPDYGFDAIYDRVSGLLRIYFLDAANTLTLKRLDISPITFLTTGDALTLSTTFGGAGTTNFGLRVARGYQFNERNVIIEAANSASTTALTRYRDVSLNLPPNAPNVGDKVVFDATKTTVFTWTASDPNTGDAPTAYQFRVERVSDSVQVYDSGKVTSTAAGLTLPMNTLANDVQYRYQVRVWDKYDLVGPYSTFDTFQTTSAGTVTITYPSADDVIDEVETAQPTISWIYAQAANVAQASYRVRVFRDSDGALVYDTTSVNSTATSVQVGTPLVSDVRYHVNVAVTNANSIGASADRYFTPNFNEPEVPVISVYGSDAAGAVIVSSTNPADSLTDDRPQPLRNDVYRRPSDLTEGWKRIGSAAPNTLYYDYDVVSGKPYDYYVVAAAATGSSTSEVVSEVSASLQGAWLHDTADPATTVQNLLYVATRAKESLGTTGVSRRYVGRRFAVVDFNDNEDLSVDLSSVIPYGPDHDLQVAKLRELIRRRGTVCFRDSRGRKVYGVILDVDIQDAADGVQVSFTVSAVDYSEATDE